MTDTLTILKDILDTELDMPTGRVWAYNANVNIPKDSNLFIILSYGDRTPYANNIKYEKTSDGMQSNQSINVNEEVIISLLSRSTQARDRVHEVYMALNSYYSENIQSKNQMHISSLGSVFDASFLEATSQINRFDVKCRVFRAYSKIKDIDYYDKYNVEIWTGDTPVIKTGEEYGN